ncbi:MAG: TonB-dependent receptor [Bacteroidales bacterium]|nr:TonB-dependent receptor [Bacteroidales bacterium]
MQKFIFIFILASVCQLSLYAHPDDQHAPGGKRNQHRQGQKTDANLTGHVLDKNTKQHIEYINVALKGTMIGTLTDLTGHYFLANLPTGEYQLVVSGLGYKTTEVPVRIVPGKTIEINIEIEEASVAMEEVVVSANRNETRRMESPIIVNVMSAKDFNLTNSCDLSQGLNYQPGLRVEMNCQNCGFPQVRINGLEGQYSQILIDSRPIFSSLSGVYGLEQIPTSMIERVEVIRGGGSALYGSNAVAGVINIITKEPLRNSFSVSNTTGLIGGSSVDANTSFNASVVSDDRKAGLFVFGNIRERNPYDHDGDGFSEIGKLRSSVAGFRGYLRTSTYSKLTLEYHHMNEFRRGGNLFDLPPHETDITEQTQYNTNGGGATFSFFSKDYKHKASVYASAQHIHRDSYYGAQKDPNAYGKTTDLSTVAGGQYSYSFDRLWFMPAELTSGIEYNYGNLSDKMLGYHRELAQKTHIIGAFLQNEWKKKNTSILIGARLDKHNLINHPIVSPRATLRQSLTSFLSARASYSYGYRAPQAYDEDLHVTAVGGEVSLIRLAPDLKQETSNSVSGSLEFNKMLFGDRVRSYFLVEGFWTKLKHVFILEEAGRDADNNLILERRNGKGATVAGLSLEGNLDFGKDWMLQAGYTFQRSMYEKPLHWSENPDVPEQKRMFRSPDHYGFFTANWTGIKGLSVALSGTITGSMQVQHILGYTNENDVYVSLDKVKQTPVFFDANLKVAYQFPIIKTIQMEVSAGIQNLFNSYQNDFDKGEFRDAGYIYGPALPRTYFAGLKFFL